jgi:hypothetical protein
VSDRAWKDPREPTFLVIGAMKAGTTSLHRCLSNHPDVFMSAPKELDFFEKNWSRGWEWYRSQFQAGDVAMLRGESSTNYAKYPRFGGVAGRIHRSLPDVKLIYLLRIWGRRRRLALGSMSLGTESRLS